jgi:pyruvate-ferredoxin/flavodoxin oxidoreductase
MMETAEAAVDYIREHMGVKVGLLHITSFRPFPSIEVVEALRHVKGMAVLERLDIPMMQSNPQLSEIKAAFADAASGTPGYPEISRVPRFFGGSAGLGSRDIRAGDFIAVVDNMLSKSPRTYFTLGIKHELALPITNDPDVRGEGSFSMRGHSVGGYGSVTTNKVIATIAGEVFGMDVQAYPKYGSEKKGLPTTYYLSIADRHILLHSELEYVDLVVLNDTTALFSGNPLDGLLKGGAIVMQSTYTDPHDVWQRIPEHHKKFIRQKKLRVFFIDMVKIARTVASEADLEMRMQGIVLLGGFLKLTPYAQDSGMSDDEVYVGVEKALRKYFGKRGDRVVQDNLTCVKRGYGEMQEIPQDVIQATT